MDRLLPEKIAAALKRPLPGRVAQRRFEPELSFGRHFGPPPRHRSARAAVLALLYPHQGEWCVPLTIRPPTMLTHAGQISFPGGGIEPDESGAHAALRELHEELGVEPERVELLGQLSPLHLFVSGYVLNPWVGVSRERPNFRCDEREVAELIEVPLAHLLDPAFHGSHQRVRRGIAQQAPHLSWGPHRIWGATAMVLGELLRVVETLRTAP